MRVFGSDISRRASPLRAAASTGFLLSARAPAIKRDYFADGPEGSRVIERIRKHVPFRALNLMDTRRVRVLGRVDVIFCRNVLIYFDERSRKKVIDMFYERLVPGGYLLLGHAESLLNVSTAFELVHLKRRPRVPKARCRDAGAREEVAS